MSALQAAAEMQHARLGADIKIDRPIALHPNAIRQRGVFYAVTSVQFGQAPFGCHAEILETKGPALDLHLLESVNIA
eukprot:SAG31_NODE_642_length_13301_cov_14.143084_10_plen_77_part_00